MNENIPLPAEILLANSQLGSLLVEACVSQIQKTFAATRCTIVYLDWCPGARESLDLVVQMFRHRDYRVTKVPDRTGRTEFIVFTNAHDHSFCVPRDLAKADGRSAERMSRLQEILQDAGWRQDDVTRDSVQFTIVDESQALAAGVQVLFKHWEKSRQFYRNR